MIGTTRKQVNRNENKTNASNAIRIFLNSFESKRGGKIRDHKKITTISPEIHLLSNDFDSRSIRTKISVSNFSRISRSSTDGVFTDLRTRHPVYLTLNDYIIVIVDSRFHEKRSHTNFCKIQQINSYFIQLQSIAYGVCVCGELNVKQYHQWNDHNPNKQIYNDLIWILSSKIEIRVCTPTIRNYSHRMNGKESENSLNSEIDYSSVLADARIKVCAKTSHWHYSMTFPLLLHFSFFFCFARRKYSQRRRIDNAVTVCAHNYIVDF